MQQRLEELEGMVSHICKAIDVDIESVSMADFKTSAGEALKRLRPVSTPGTGAGEGSSTGRSASLDTSESGHLNDFPDQQDYSEDAPLLNLFKDAMFIQRNNSQDDRERLDATIERRVNACVGALSTFLPSTQDLIAILDTTEKYWPIWTVTPNDLVANDDSIQPVTSAYTAKEFILHYLDSGVPSRAAKSILWLALCIQQLPNSFAQQRQLPSQQKILVDSYLSGADTLLSINQDSEKTFEDVQCLMLRAKLYINMGKPRKCWLDTRHAMNLCILLGLHHVKDNTEEHHRAMWTQIWEFDRYMSATLGFPYGIAESHPGLSAELAGKHFTARAMYNIAIIAGHITDRNQNFNKVSYSATANIEKELESCQAAIPTDWWDTISTPDIPLYELYGRQSIKIYYYQACRNLHLPYVLQASKDKRYEHNKKAAMNASREMIKAYRTLRSNGGDSIIMCDLMDFQVFSSAVLIVIELISQPSDCIYQEGEDWGLVQNVTQHFDSVAAGMECSVAGQAAQLLEYLSMAHQGTYTGPEGYEAVIPYFGKVRIGKMKGTQPTMSMNGQINAPQLFTNTIEFDSSSFMPFSQDPTAGYNFTDAELGFDWTSTFDDSKIYDWSQAFEFTGSGQLGLHA
ncbi:Dehydrocurvularin biosynthesis regulator [Lachnellula suecica]|uniref:Dehydrocurvularin biosynthesis regulator n=1 Tax=Lachnellula suecica TaxID=602035 RepID=A0A8T9C7X6_9HELO|nr:Dehydrocurvularin biosynthesis regulator [Lachnellula suecica]